MGEKASHTCKWNKRPAFFLPLADPSYPDQYFPNSGSNATGAFVLLRVYAYDKLSPNKVRVANPSPPFSLSMMKPFQ